MRAWLLQDFTGLSALRLAEVPGPSPAAGEVVLDLQFAGLNPADRYLAENQYPAKPALPHVLGRDGVGIVSALGAGVAQFKIGDQLLILRGDTGVKRFGTFAQQVAVSVDSLVQIPDGWTTEQAAGASLVYLTAYQALTQWGALRERVEQEKVEQEKNAENPHPTLRETVESRQLSSGKTLTPALSQSTERGSKTEWERGKEVVLITGASGGVGVASVQLARAMGHTVIALSRDEKKRQTLLELGAAHVVDPTQADWAKNLRDKIHPRRVDLAIDNIGGEQFSQLLDTLNMNGKVSVVGRLAGAVPQFNTASLFFRRLKIGGVAVGTYTHAESRAAWDQIVRLLQSIHAAPLVDCIFPFDALPAAFERLAKGPMGKVLLDIKKVNK